jgi:hypothetical protein|tara:strand:+ start:246 stop:356 length:111 start_codon:yes stop_codon:yes gene_type:complete
MVVLDKKAEGVDQTRVVGQVPEGVVDSERKIPGTNG